MSVVNMERSFGLVGRLMKRMRTGSGKERGHSRLEGCWGWWG